MHNTPMLKSSILSLGKFFGEIEAFTIPEYQRTYQWKVGNIEKLFSDIVASISMLAEASEVEKELRFLGSIITITNTHKKFGDVNLQATNQIVDGQQRITTISIVAMVIHDSLSKLFEDYSEMSSNTRQVEMLKKNIFRYQSALREIYSFEKKALLGKSVIYPSIIREESDLWGEKKEQYLSPVSSLAYQYITNPGNFETDNRNLSDVLKSIKDLIEAVGKNDFTNMSNGDIFETYHLEMLMLKVGKQIFEDDDGELTRYCVGKLTESSDGLFLNITRVVVFAYYLLRKCYVNHINTDTEDTAFDMFIGLNTTGIPLSSVETFRAHILKEAVNLRADLGIVVRERANAIFSTGDSSIESYFDGVKNQEKKEKRIKEYVTAFALFYSGEKVGYNPNSQRDYLKKTYNRDTASSDQVDRKNKQLQFLESLHNFTKFQVALDESPPSILSDSTLGSHQYIRETSLLSMAFLSDIDHSIAYPLWARVNEKFAQNGTTEDALSFANVVNATAAFFALWRSISGTNGLPEVYRNWMASYYSVSKSSHVEVADIKLQMRNQLASMRGNLRDFTDRDKWVAQAATNLRMASSADLCRFILIWTCHNTTVDTTTPGLITEAKSGFQEFAKHSNWKSPHLKSLEHIAPRNREENSKWDELLYGTDTLFDSVGNLVLLPLDLNTSLSNREWNTKLYYYRYVVEETSDKREKFVKAQTQAGVDLDVKTLRALVNSSFSGQLKPIVEYGNSNSDGWSADIVRQRTTRILEIFHDRMMGFLN